MLVRFWNARSVALDKHTSQFCSWWWQNHKMSSSFLCELINTRSTSQYITSGSGMRVANYLTGCMEASSCHARILLLLLLLLLQLSVANHADVSIVVARRRCTAVGKRQLLNHVELFVTTAAVASIWDSRELCAAAFNELTHGQDEQSQTVRKYTLEYFNVTWILRY